MSEVFEVGKMYEANDPGIEPIIILKRTEQFIWVKNYLIGNSWRMRIKHDNRGDEILVDSSGQSKWYKEAHTYCARWATE